MTADAPLVSVLLPARNASPFVREALDSLARQSMRNFEVLVVDDGSTDDTSEKVAAMAAGDPRFSLFRRERGGVATALNFAFSKARGRFLARMDADDIAEPTRFAQQVRHMEERPAVGVCGSWARICSEEKSWVLRVPTTDDAIRARLVFGSALVHPSVMLRREALAGLPGPYETDAPPLEDYRLWLALARHTRFHNLPKVLLRYRQHPGQATAQSQELGRTKLRETRCRFLDNLGIPWSDRERQLHEELGIVSTGDFAAGSREVCAWLERLRVALPAKGWCSAAALAGECSDAWWRFMRGRRGTIAAAWTYWRAPVVLRTPRTLLRMARLALPR